jgi:hypothetical protein
MKSRRPEKLSAELERLLSGLCDGLLSEGDFAKLEEMLESDSKYRRFYIEYLDLHARLLFRHDVCGPDALPDRTGCAEDGRPDRSQAAPSACGVISSEVDRRRVSAVFRYFLVAGTTLAASVVFQLLWLHPSAAVQEARPPASKSAQSLAGIYVATLTEAADCVWGQAQLPANAGARLRIGPMTLQKGFARIRFDSGPDLLVEGPASVHLDSSAEATVFHGKVVFRADETATPFDLHTPFSTLVDQGAEYAVDVSPAGEEEIHVFDGDVQRVPMADTTGAVPERLTAGEARSYGPHPESPGRPASFDPTRFVRHLDPLGQKVNDIATGLLAYEGFDYNSPHLLRMGNANGGFGWIGPWTPGFARPQVNNDLNVLALNVKESLFRPGCEAASVGGSFDYNGFAKYHRRLASPVRLDRDGVYFLSFLFRREGPQADAYNSLAILLRPNDEIPPDKWDARKRLNIGVVANNQLTTHWAGIGCKTPIPLLQGETYLMVAKIVASRSNPDQVFLRVYGPEERIEHEETGSWTVIGPQFESSLVFDWLEIHINSKTRQTMDEIRLGSTWSAVTAPWISRAKGNR